MIESRRKPRPVTCTRCPALTRSGISDIVADGGDMTLLAAHAWAGLGLADAKIGGRITKGAANAAITAVLPAAARKPERLIIRGDCRRWTGRWRGARGNLNRAITV